MKIITKLYFIGNKIKDMDDNVRKLNKILTMKPDLNHSDEIKEVKRRIRESCSDILEILDRDETTDW